MSGAAALCQACGRAGDRVFEESVERALAQPAGRARWLALSALLAPSFPHEAHRAFFNEAYRGVDAPHFAWYPEDETANGSNAAQVARDCGVSAHGAAAFEELHTFSVEHPEQFWSAVITRMGLHGTLTGDVLKMDRSAGARGVEQAQFWPTARFNIGERCLAAQPSRPAIVYGAQSRGDAQLSSMSYAVLRGKSLEVARALRASGFTDGQPIAIDMPMTAEDVIQRPDKTLPLYEKVLKASPPPCIVLPMNRDTIACELRDIDMAWSSFLEGASRNPDFEPHDAPGTHFVNILFSSGTTGDPKAIPWTQLSAFKAAADAFLHLNMGPDDVICWPTNIGWMMGPWLIFAALVNGATVALYEGVPTTAGFVDFVRDAHVTVLGVVPSMVRAWRAAGICTDPKWNDVRLFSSTGEASNPDDYLWLMSRVQGYRPVIEYCGGTEIAGSYITGSTMQPQAPSMFSTPTLGIDFILISEDGSLIGGAHRAPDGETIALSGEGEVALIPPSPGLSMSLLNRDHFECYFEGMKSGPRGEVLRRHGDQLERLACGYYKAHGRVDDTMNIGGIKTSSAEVERACAVSDAVHEAAAVAVPPPEGGPDRLVVFVVLEPNAERGDEETLRKELQALLSAELNPLFRISAVRVVPSLPRTASNKFQHWLLPTPRGRETGMAPVLAALLEALANHWLGVLFATALAFAFLPQLREAVAIAWRKMLAAPHYSRENDLKRLRAALVMLRMRAKATKRRLEAAAAEHPAAGDSSAPDGKKQAGDTEPVAKPNIAPSKREHAQLVAHCSDLEERLRNALASDTFVRLFSRQTRRTKEETSQLVQLARTVMDSAALYPELKTEAEHANALLEQAVQAK